MCTSLVTSSTVRIATASPAVCGGIVKVSGSVREDRLQKDAQRAFAADLMSDVSVKSRYRAQPWTQCGPASSRSFGESAMLSCRHRAGLAGGSSLCSCGGFTAVLSTCERGRENSVNV